MTSTRISRRTAIGMAGVWMAAVTGAALRQAPYPRAP